MAHVTLLQYGARDFQLPATDPPQLDSVQDRPFLAFDDTTPENAKTAALTMPGQYAGGTLKATMAYFMAGANTSKLIEFLVSVQAISDGDATDMDAGDVYDTANASGGVTVPATAGPIDYITVTLTNKDSMAALDSVRFKLERDAADATNDTAVGGARVLWMEIWESTA